MATIRFRAGKFHVQFRRKGQRSVTKSFINKRDAEVWARQIEVLADRSDLPQANAQKLDIKLKVLVVRYIDTVISNKKCSEYETFILTAFLRHPICQKSLKELSTSDFAKYRDERLTEIKAGSLKRQLNPIHNMFEIARDEWGIPIKENPLAKLKLKGTDNRRERRLKEGEYQKLIQAAETRKNPWIKFVIIFAIQTGMREGDILSLQ
jgi:integrase